MKDETTTGITVWLITHKLLLATVILFVGQLGIQLIGANQVTMRWIAGNLMTSSVSALGILSFSELRDWGDAETTVALVAVALIGVNGVVAIIKGLAEKYSK